MNIAAKKINLIQWILSLDNEDLISFLEGLSQENLEWDNFSAKQKEGLLLAIQEADAGKMVSHESVVNETRAKYREKE